MFWCQFDVLPGRGTRNSARGRCHGIGLGQERGNCSSRLLSLLLCKIEYGTFRQHAKFIYHTDSKLRVQNKTRVKLSMTPINILQNLLLASCPSKLSQRIWRWWQRATNSTRGRRSSIPHTRWFSRYTQMQVVHLRSILLVKRNRRCHLLCPWCWCIAPGV
jgi:hypothetical protein